MPIVSNVNAAKKPNIVVLVITKYVYSLTLQLESALEQQESMSPVKQGDVRDFTILTALHIFSVNNPQSYIQ